MARTPEQAIAWANTHRGKFGWDNLCLSFVRQSFGIDYVGDWPTSSRNAGTAWDRARIKHRETDPMKIPRGVPVFFELATVADHVVLSLGNGRCLTNDFSHTRDPRIPDGMISEESIADISARWGPMLGWTEDLVGNRVVPGTTPPPAVVPRPIRGVDFSHWNDLPARWQLMRNAGVRFAYMKVTEGATVVDSAYKSRRASLDKFNADLSLLGRILGRGIRPGGFHFASPDGGDAAVEADWFVKHLTVGKYDVAPVLDFEELGPLTMAQADAWCVRWIRRVQSHGFTHVGIYLPNSWNLPAAQKAASFVWRARYNDDNRPPDLAYDIHQFSDGELGTPDRVAGYGGKLDLNTLRKGFRVRAMRLKKAGSTPPPPPPPPPDPEPDKPLRIGTRNVRGTRARGFDDPAERATYAVREANALGITVSTLQELSTPQVERITSEAHPRWEIHAGIPNVKRKNGVNSGNGIMWRRDRVKVLARGDLSVRVGKVDSKYVVPEVLHFPWILAEVDGEEMRLLGVHYPGGIKNTPPPPGKITVLAARRICTDAVTKWGNASTTTPTFVAGDTNGRSLRNLGSFVEHKVDRVVSPNRTLTDAVTSPGWVDGDGKVHKVSDHFGLSGEVEL